MKKLMTAVAAFFCLIMSSCGGGNAVDVASVASRLASGETLTEADYTSMINYCEDYAKKAQGYYDVINAAPNDSTAEAIKATNSLADLMAGAKYLEPFRKALFAANAQELGSENARRMEELSKYEAFPIADVSDSTMMNPEQVGDVVETPNSDTTGVVAAGDGVAVK